MCFKEIDSRSFKRHVDHCSQPPVHCPHCHKSFTRSHNLNCHLKNSCKQLRRPEPSVPVIIPQEPIPELPIVLPVVPVAEPVDEPVVDESETQEQMELSDMSGIEPMDFSEPSQPKRKLVDYESSSSEDTPPSPKRYCCPHCSDSFRSYQARQRHVEQDHSESLFGSQTNYFDAEGEALINHVFDREAEYLTNYEYRRRTNEQVGGQLPLFDFNLRSVGPRRRWRNTVSGARFYADVIQHRDPTNRDDIGIALSEALYRALFVNWKIIHVQLM